jgi:hypothetical protein
MVGPVGTVGQPPAAAISRSRRSDRDEARVFRRLWRERQQVARASAAAAAAARVAPPSMARDCGRASRGMLMVEMRPPWMSTAKRSTERVSISSNWATRSGEVSLARARSSPTR